MLLARIYLRVSTNEQDLQRQEKLIEDTKNKGFYIAAVYREKISGAIEWQQRPELSRLISELQPNDVVIAESIDRLTRLEPAKALELIEAIKSKGAKIQVPELFDMDTLSGIIRHSNGSFDPQFLMSDLFLGLQNMFLKWAVSVAHDDYQKRRERQKQGILLAKQAGKYKGKRANTELHKAIIMQRNAGMTIEATAKLLNTSTSTVVRVWRNHNKNRG